MNYRKVYLLFYFTYIYIYILLIVNLNKLLNIVNVINEVANVHIFIKENL